MVSLEVAVLRGDFSQTWRGLQMLTKVRVQHVPGGLLQSPAEAKVYTAKITIRGC